MSDLDKILSDEPFEDSEEVEETLEETTEEEPEEEGPQEEPEEAEAKPDPEPKAEPVKDQEPLVPLTALKQVREELRQLKAMQPKPEPKPAPDFYENPEAAMQHHMQQPIEQMQNIRLDMSEEMARQAYGDDVVNEAFQAFQASQDAAAYQAIMQARSPYHELVKWHKQQRVVNEIGPDPDKWVEAQRAAIRAEVEAELKAQAVSESVARAAPSLAKKPNLGSRTGPKEIDPDSITLDDILGG